ncbi:hypothetical protein EDB87DRAFT_1578197 [Lactarius vividus]|nr:hypothetical protein EDB87DRAFT_1578197 [Lactarius vividus]
MGATMGLLSAAQKYELSSVLAHIRLCLAQRDPYLIHKDNAFRVYSLVQKDGLRQEAVYAAQLALKFFVVRAVWTDIDAIDRGIVEKEGNAFRAPISSPTAVITTRIHGLDLGYFVASIVSLAQPSNNEVVDVLPIVQLSDDAELRALVTALYLIPFEMPPLKYEMGTISSSIRASVGYKLRLFEGWALRALVKFRVLYMDSVISCFRSFFDTIGPSKIWVACLGPKPRPSFRLVKFASRNTCPGLTNLYGDWTIR